MPTYLKAALVAVLAYLGLVDPPIDTEQARSDAAALVAYAMMAAPVTPDPAPAPKPAPLLPDTFRQSAVILPELPADLVLPPPVPPIPQPKPPLVAQPKPVKQQGGCPNGVCTPTYRTWRGR